MATKKQTDKAVVERVRRELRRRKGGWKELPKAGNKKFTYRWVAAFAKGSIKDPSYTHLCALARVLDIDIGVRDTCAACGRRRSFTDLATPIL